MSGKKDLTPEQRIEALEAAAETEKQETEDRIAAIELQTEELQGTVDSLTEENTGLKAENADLKAKVEEFEANSGGKTATEIEDEDKKGRQPQPPAPTEPAPLAENAGVTAEEIASAVADAVAPISERLLELEGEVKAANTESGKTKQPGGEETILEAEENGGVAGDREGQTDENPYASLFATDPVIAKMNVEELTYEEACDRDDSLGLQLLTAMEELHGPEHIFNEKNAAA